MSSTNLDELFEDLFNKQPTNGGSRRKKGGMPDSDHPDGGIYEDVLREVNRKPVGTIEDAISAISSIKSSGSITIIRSGRRVSLRFRL